MCQGMTYLHCAMQENWITYGDPEMGCTQQKPVSLSETAFYAPKHSNFVWSEGIKKAWHYRARLLFVGVTGFEPATPCTPCKYATGLRHTPNFIKTNQRILS